jgi:hypothetical protein
MTAIATPSLRLVAVPSQLARHHYQINNNPHALFLTGASTGALSGSVQIFFIARIRARKPFFFRLSRVGITGQLVPTVWHHWVIGLNDSPISTVASPGRPPFPAARVVTYADRNLRLSNVISLAIYPQWRRLKGGLDASHNACRSTLP